MTPSQKHSLRLSWYGLSLPWPLYPDLQAHPYFLSANENGIRWRRISVVQSAARSAAVLQREARQ